MNMCPEVTVNSGCMELRPPFLRVLLDSHAQSMNHRPTPLPASQNNFWILPYSGVLYSERCGMKVNFTPQLSLVDELLTRAIRSNLSL